MSTPLNRWHGYGFGLLFVVTLWVISSANASSPRHEPWPVRVAGGTVEPWTPALKAEWQDVMACTGMRKDPDTTVTIWRLPAHAPHFYVDQARSLDVWLGWYFVGPHAIVMRTLDDSAQARTLLRHEMLHAALRSAHSKHEYVFHQYAAGCNLGTVERGK
jgi:hypothetical protein